MALAVLTVFWTWPWLQCWWGEAVVMIDPFDAFAGSHMRFLVIRIPEFLMILQRTESDPKIQ